MRRGLCFGSLCRPPAAAEWGIGMSECMLCQVRRAEHPYIIESIGLPVYTVEELLYFMQHNAALLDESILNEELLRWIKEELRMRRLSASLSVLMQRKFRPDEFVLPIFRETGYPDAESIRVFSEELSKLEELPHPARVREKGNQLFRHRRYTLAIRAYEKAAEESRDSDLGQQFTGMVFHNIGCAYARLFQFEEAGEYLNKGRKLLKTRESLKDYLYILRFLTGSGRFKKAAIAEGADEKLIREVEDSAWNLQIPELPEDRQAAIDSWVGEYHRDLGM